MNGDIIDSDAIIKKFQIYSTNNLWNIPNINILNEASYIENKLTIGDISKWLTEIMYDVNSSEIKQHRKNFYQDLRNLLNRFNFYTSGLNRRDYLIKISPDFRNYNDISIILKFLRNNMSGDMKIILYREFVEKHINRYRGKERRKYIYGRTFRGRNGNGGPSAVNDYLNYLIKNVDEYYIERCEKLFDALVEKTRPPHFGHSNGPSLFAKLERKYEHQQIIAMFEEDLLND